MKLQRISLLRTQNDHTTYNNQQCFNCVQPSKSYTQVKMGDFSGANPMRSTATTAQGVPAKGENITVRRGQRKYQKPSVEKAMRYKVHRTWIAACSARIASVALMRTMGGVCGRRVRSVRFRFIRNRLGVSFRTTCSSHCILRTSRMAAPPTTAACILAAFPPGGFVASVAIVSICGAKDGLG